MAPLYRKALIIGATSGIGAALAAKLLATGSHSPSSSSSSTPSAGPTVTDVTDLASLPAFAAELTDKTTSHLATAVPAGTCSRSRSRDRSAKDNNSSNNRSRSISSLVFVRTPGLQRESKGGAALQQLGWFSRPAVQTRREMHDAPRGTSPDLVGGGGAFTERMYVRGASRCGGTPSPTAVFEAAQRRGIFEEQAAPGAEGDALAKYVRKEKERS
ncbi:hypothetical protein F4809DRAFT_663119 [Biscogniauxia mediterranea]|nr:hypothetical protein F4809DRAFT_663119 [Biscogniauxia mediterranea]